MGHKDVYSSHLVQLLHTRALQVFTACILVLILLMHQTPKQSTVENAQLPDASALSVPAARAAAAAATDLMQLSTKSREWFLTHPSLHCARHEIVSNGRVSQSPFASGDTFRSMADHVLDDYTDKPGADWRPSDVQQGDIIFVKTDLLPKFFSDRHPYINATYVLISHNGAFAVPVDKRSKCKDDRCSSYIKDPKLGHWYGKNMLPGYGPKTMPLPIGLASRFYPHGDHIALLTLAKSVPAWESRPTSVYIAMDNNTNSVRRNATAQLSKLPGVQLVTERVNYTTYLRQVADAKFVAAPPGWGIDTHRAFEAIYLGAVPIIQTGPLDYLYEGLPVLLVDDYSKVTTILLANYEAKRAAHYNTERAWAIYWYQEFKHRQRLIRAAAARQH